ncbi:hypothetical protein [Actinomadura madurae]|uniref:hypothetical protein n=1 Tax=Actinomadura madurae TaxID=1993 RepID=UPI0020D22C38|nr:hypothetical protein [Actinomadura madurae]MCP9982114.1 hypothetical protein [Actinomadura madurae]
MPRKPVPLKRRRRARVLVVAGVAAVLVAAVAVTAGALAGGGEAPKKKPEATVSAAPPAWTVAAGRALTSGTGLRYDGTLTVNGQPVQAHLRVTPSGAVTGTFTAGLLKADVVAIDGDTYLKAAPAFWQTYAGGVAHPEYYAGRWSKAPASMPGFDVPDVLGPEAIAESLAKAPAEPPTENVNGVRAYRVKTPGAEYLLTAAAPHRLLAVRPAGQAGPRFTVAPVTAPGDAVRRAAAAGGPARRGRRPGPALHPGDADVPQLRPEHQRLHGERPGHARLARGGGAGRGAGRAAGGDHVPGQAARVVHRVGSGPGQPGAGAALHRHEQAVAELDARGPGQPRLVPVRGDGPRRR